MKIQHTILLFVLATFPVVGTAQCPKAGTKPVWDSSKAQFRCADTAAGSESAQSAIVPPTGDKAYCKSVRETLQRACPSHDQGKTCKNSAKSIFDACHKESDSSSSGSAASSSNRPDAAAACMETYRQQQQACQTRTSAPRAPGQPYTPDTCLSDAMAAQNKCLANAR